MFHHLSENKPSSTLMINLGLLLNNNNNNNTTFLNNNIFNNYLQNYNNYTNNEIPVDNIIIYSLLSFFYGIIFIGSIIICTRIIYLEYIKKKKILNFLQKKQPTTISNNKINNLQNFTNNEEQQENLQNNLQNITENNLQNNLQNKNEIKKALSSYKDEMFIAANIISNQLNQEYPNQNHFNYYNTNNNNEFTQNNFNFINNEMTNNYYQSEENLVEDQFLVNNYLIENNFFKDNDKTDKNEEVAPLVNLQENVVNKEDDKYLKDNFHFFSDKKLIFTIIILISFFRFLQFILQATISTITTFREILVIISTCPAFLFITLMLIFIFFWIEISDFQKFLQNDLSNVLIGENQEVNFLKKFTKNILKKIKEKIKYLFIGLNILIYLIMIVVDIFLFLDFVNKDYEKIKDDNYTITELISVLIPIILFLFCALFILFLGILLFFKLQFHYLKSNIIKKIMKYIVIVTLIDVFILILRSVILILQIKFTFLEKSWGIILVYYLLGEIFPLLVLNYVLLQMSVNLKEEREIENTSSSLTNNQSITNSFKKKKKQKKRQVFSIADRYYREEEEWKGSLEEDDESTNIGVLSNISNSLSSKKKPYNSTTNYGSTEYLKKISGTTGTTDNSSDGSSLIVSPNRKF
ncbi:hypothetical protein ABK040_008063 [Willaertia magna]